MEVEVFSDETYFENYIGIACLFVPTKHKQEFVKKLNNLRCYNSNWSWCFENCKNESKCSEINHDYNNSEIHYTKLNKATHNKKIICDKWLDFFMNYNKGKIDDNCIYLRILYIDLNKLDISKFGDTKDKNNIYNRFYRTVIIATRKFFFTDQHFVIKEFFHDKGSDKESHSIFPWHTPTKLNKSRNFNILKEDISFIDSDHRKYDNNYNKENSQLIQFVDLILGSVTETIFHKATNKNKRELCNKIYPLVRRLWRNPKNKNSSYNYYRKIDVSIFPLNKIRYQKDLFDKLQRIDGQFHRNIPIREIRDYKNETGPLDKYF